MLSYNTNHYNPDAVISIEYRINRSKECFELYDSIHLQKIHSVRSVKANFWCI